MVIAISAHNMAFLALIDIAYWQSEAHRALEYILHNRVKCTGPYVYVGDDYEGKGNGYGNLFVFHNKLFAIKGEPLLTSNAFSSISLPSSILSYIPRTS